VTDDAERLDRLERALQQLTSELAVLKRDRVARSRCRLPAVPTRLLSLFALLLGLNAIAAAQEPLTPFQREKVRALLDVRLPCRGCHVVGGTGGRVGPSLDDVGARRSASYIRAMIEDPQRVVPSAAMPRVPMPDAMRHLVVRYFADHASGSNTAPVTAQANRPTAGADGKSLYVQWCASCHGADGHGTGPNAKWLAMKPANHANAARMSTRADDALYDTIAGGGTVMGMSPLMPAFGATLSDAQIRALVAYLRTICACNGPEWSRGAR
jgi:cytochrome c oxidase cbb3-type subunit 3